MSKGEIVIGSFWDILNKMMWLDKYKMKDSLKGYKPSEVHCIDYIGKHTDANVTKLAESFYITRSATSKITTKLMEKGVIESYQKADNKKEIYFRLTKKGKSVYDIHEGLHKEFQDRDKAIFEQVSDEQYDIMIAFAKKYSEHLDEEIKKLDLHTKSPYYDKL